MMTMDYTFERRLEFQCEEATEKGRAEGRKEGIQTKRHELIEKKLLKRKSLEQIAEELEEDPDELRPLYERMRRELEAQRGI